MAKHRFGMLLFLCATLIAQMSPATQLESAPGSKAWSMARELCSDTKAGKIGDLLTVIIEEEDSIKVDAKNSSAKKSTASGQMSFGHPRIDDRPTSWTNAVIPAWSIETANAFEGDGKMENKNKFTSRITVRVTDIAPNGNLMIEGKRSIIMQQENVTVITTGTVRPADITRDNTIQSSRIADTAVRYVSSGPVIKGQERGWLMSLLNRVNPF